jgi:hypothetical protein
MVDETGRACGRMLGILQELSELASLEETDLVPALTGVQVFAVCDHALKALQTEDGPAPVFICHESDRSTVVDGNAAWLKRAFSALMAATAREHRMDTLECHGFVVGGGESQHAVMAFGPSGFSHDRENLMAHRAGYDRWRGGTGLSLPIACRMIEAHGGSVWSPEGFRSSVWTLPVATSRYPRP